MSELTKDQYQIAKKLYKEYLLKRKTEDIHMSKYFNDSTFLQSTYFRNLSVDDVTDLCWSLHRLEFLVCQPGNDLANDIFITDKLILFFENESKSFLTSLLDKSLKLIKLFL